MAYLGLAASLHANDAAFLANVENKPLEQRIDDLGYKMVVANTKDFRTADIIFIPEAHEFKDHEKSLLEALIVDKNDLVLLELPSDEMNGISEDAVDVDFSGDSYSEKNYHLVQSLKHEQNKIREQIDKTNIIVKASKTKYIVTLQKGIYYGFDIERKEKDKVMMKIIDPIIYSCIQENEGLHEFEKWFLFEVEGYRKLPKEELLKHFPQKNSDFRKNIHYILRSKKMKRNLDKLFQLEGQKIVQIGLRHITKEYLYKISKKYSFIYIVQKDTMEITDKEESKYVFSMLEEYAKIIERTRGISYEGTFDGLYERVLNAKRK